MTTNADMEPWDDGPATASWRPNYIHVGATVVLPDALIDGGARLDVSRQIPLGSPPPEMWLIDKALTAIVQGMREQLARRLGVARHKAPALSWPAPFVVVRARDNTGRDAFSEWLRERGYEGKWYELAQFKDLNYQLAMERVDRHFTAESTGRYEIRDDGAIAEVYEARP
jgi:hypothetical protein